jgi:hypothetical protein
MVPPGAVALHRVDVAAGLEGVITGVLIGAPAAARSRIEGRAVDPEAAEVAGLSERVGDGTRGVLGEGPRKPRPELARNQDERRFAGVERASVGDVRSPTLPRL